MKRLFDFSASLAAIVILSPLLLLLSLLVLLDDGGPVLFKQERVGKDNRLFIVWKFRTMKKGTPHVAAAKLEKPVAYMTRTGAFLRRSGLDEIPQLFNILRGEMSFVGPRPLIPEEEEIRQLRLEYHVYAVRPGLTGLAQIHGLNNLSDPEKARYDKQYVETRSFWLDIKILFQTIFVVLKRNPATEHPKDSGSENHDHLA